MKSKIAIIGSGISGLASAWLLNRRHEVHLFEKRSRLGGHTHTVQHTTSGQPIGLDTGFIVYNELTYPHLTRVFDQLGIATQESDMSFAVSCQKPDLEFSGQSLRALAAQPGNYLRPWYLEMLKDIWRFGRVGQLTLRDKPDPSATLADFLRDEDFGDAFGKFFLLPMAAAIWSTGTGPTEDFPRDTLLHFFANHGLLNLRNQPQWRTVSGGSSTYINAMTRSFSERVHTGMGVEKISRNTSGVRVHFDNGASADFDHVVIAAHANQALAMLDQPSSLERELLGAWRYSRNDTWLHTDEALMPRRRAVWASWNYLIDNAEQQQKQVSVSYHLNRLQRIDSDTQYMVTLNPSQAPRQNSVIRRMTYFHPVYDTASIATQADLPRLNGHNRTHFCGAYFRNGFHEDGLVSALQVASDFGIEL